MPTFQPSASPTSNIVGAYISSLSEVAGTKGQTSDVDGVGTNAHLSSPFGLGITTSGSLYFYDDTYSNVRQIATDGELTMCSCRFCEALSIIRCFCRYGNVCSRLLKCAYRLQRRDRYQCAFPFVVWSGGL
jgi:hypothetical protein